MTAQVSIFINPDDTHNVNRTGGTGTVAIRVNEPGEVTTIFLDNDTKSKAGALAVLARLTAAVEALPDDTHAGQGVLPTEPEMLTPWGGRHAKSDLCDAFKCTPVGAPLGAPVWRTLTFGDLRAGDVFKEDEAGPAEVALTAHAVPSLVGAPECQVVTDDGVFYHLEADPVLVRHPRPEVGQ